jgi:hypothetical protein
MGHLKIAWASILHANSCVTTPLIDLSELAYIIDGERWSDRACAALSLMELNSAYNKEGVHKKPGYNRTNDLTIQAPSAISRFIHPYFKSLLLVAELAEVIQARHRVFKALIAKSPTVSLQHTSQLFQQCRGKLRLTINKGIQERENYLKGVLGELVC